MPSDAKAEIIEKCNATSNGYPGVENRRVVNHLMPTARNVEERRHGGDRGQGQNGDDEEDREGTEKPFVTNCYKRRDGIVFCLGGRSIRERWPKEYTRTHDFL